MKNSLLLLLFRAGTLQSVERLGYKLNDQTGTE
jgi:hypothetical protein